MDIRKEIINIVEINCLNLQIDKPAIRFVDANEFATPTTQAAAARNGSEIIVNNDFIDSKPDLLRLWLVISHEVRHIWQSKHGGYFDSYKTSEELSLQEYNEQKAEIDAWAWTFIALDFTFGVRPTLEENFGKEFMRKVYDRANEILE